MCFDPAECRAQLFQQHSRNEKRNAKTQRVCDQQQRAAQRGAGCGREHKRRAEECADAGRQAHRVDHAEHECGHETADLALCLHALEERQADHIQITQPQQDDDKAADGIQRNAVAHEQRADCASEQPKRTEYNRKAQHKCGAARERFAAAVVAGGEIGNVDRQHRQHARGDKGNDAFEKRNQELHRDLLPFFGIIT